MFLLSCILFLAYISAQRQEHLAQEEVDRRVTTIAEVGSALGAARQASTNATNARINHEQEAWVRWGEVTTAAYADFFRVLDKLAVFDPEATQVIRDAAKDAWPKLNDQAFKEFSEKRADMPTLRELSRRFTLIEETLQQSKARAAERSQLIREDSERRLDLGQRVAVGLTIVTSLAISLVVLTVVRSILAPLGVVIEAVRQVNAGETELDLPTVADGEFGEVAQAVRVFRTYAEKLQRQAYRDALTGLGNRFLLVERLQHLFSIEEHGFGTALLYLDIDRFRSIDERAGTHGANRYLVEIASRLARLVPDDAELFRDMGDKFVVLIPEVRLDDTTRSQLTADAAGLMRVFQEPYFINREPLSTTATVGIAFSPEDGSSPEQLIRSADAASAAAKDAGRGKIRFASGEQTSLLRARAVLAAEITRGLKRGEFCLHYQPIIDYAQRRVVAAEALMRWQHPERGLLSAGAFIAVAEEEGLISLIGEESLRLAHLQAAKWRDQGFDMLLSVNLSARQMQEGVLDRLRALRADFGPGPCRIDLELTESALFESTSAVREMLQEMRKMGYRLALDDFGTGYSSLSYLLRLPIDKIKVDRQFVSEMESRQETMAVVGATITLARILKLEVIAEGVETASQADRLFEEGCALLQGFYFSPALPTPEFEAWVHRYNKAVVAQSI